MSHSIGKHHKGYFIYHDKSGEVKGMGEEIEFVRQLKPGVKEVQTAQLGVGSLTENKVQIDEPTYTDINDPKKAIWLKDFKVKAGKLEKIKPKDK